MSTVKLHVGPVTYEIPEMEFDTGFSVEEWSNLSEEYKAFLSFGLESKYRRDLRLDVYALETFDTSLTKA